MTKTELYSEYINKYPSLTPSELTELIIKEHPNKFQSAKARSIAASISKVKSSLEVDLEDDTKWSIIADHYHWKTLRGTIHLSVEFIDQLFFEYSEHGLNLSQTKIINKHQLKVWEWHSIKRVLQLYKQSHVFSPYTVEITPSEKMEQMVAEKVSKVFSSVSYQVEDQFNKQLRQSYKKVIKQQAQDDLVYQTIITDLQDFVIDLPQLEVIPIYRTLESPNEKEINVFIFDVHFGAESRIKGLPEYSPQKTEEVFTEMANTINSYNAKKVNLFFGGDSIESFTGMNRPDSWQGLAKGYYGSELVKRGYITFVEFISKVNNVGKVLMVPGNHDRATESKKVDARGYIGAILYELIMLSFKSSPIEFQYDEKLISVSIDGLHYLMSHGHLRLSDMTPAELILEYGDPYKFNVLVSGHWHKRMIKKDNKNFRQIICPSVFPGNDYSIDLGVSSLPGYLIIENTGSGKPLIHDYSL